MDYNDASSNDTTTSFAKIFIFILIFGLSLFAAKSSSKNQVPFIEKDFRPNDPVIWFFVCLLACGLGFLWYLYRLNLVLELRAGKAAPAAPPLTAAQIPQAGSNALEEQLENLRRLKEKGLISEAEWEQKKRQLLEL